MFMVSRATIFFVSILTSLVIGRRRSGLSMMLNYCHGGMIGILVVIVLKSTGILNSLLMSGILLTKGFSKIPGVHILSLVVGLSSK